MKSLITLSLVAILMSSPSFAMDLQSARKNGVVAEQATGYITAVKPSPEVDALVADVNAKRKTEYERIAKEKGSKVEDVAAIAAQELRKK